MNTGVLPNAPLYAAWISVYHATVYSPIWCSFCSILFLPTDSLLGSPTGGISDQAIPLASVRAFSFLLVGTHDGQ